MGSGIEDFFGQIPPGMIIVFCGSGILLLGVIAYGLWSRARRRRLDEVPPASINVVTVTERAAEVQPIMNTVNSDMPPMDMDDDLPDLDILSHPGEAKASVPVSPPPLTQTLKYAAPAPTPAMDEGATPPPAPVRPAAAYRVMLNSGETADAVEVLTVLRDVADGSLIIQIGSKSYRHPAEGADADFMRRLNGALRDLNAGASAPTGSAPAPAPKPAAPPPAASTSGVGGEDYPSFDPPSPSPTSTGTTQAYRPPTSGATTSSTGTTQAAKPPLPGDLPKFRIEDQPPMTGRRGNKGPKVEIPEINIGASIEAFLQHKRVQNGDFSGRRIHVRSGLGGAIVIEVDGQFYDAVGDVKDPTVRAYLQETIEEWQSRQ